MHAILHVQYRKKLKRNPEDKDHTIDLDLKIMHKCLQKYKKSIKKAFFSSLSFSTLWLLQDRNDIKPNDKNMISEFDRKALKTVQLSQNQEVFNYLKELT